MGAIYRAPDISNNLRKGRGQYEQGQGRYFGGNDVVGWRGERRGIKSVIKHKNPKIGDFMKKRLVLASIVILVCSVYPCAADGKPPKGTVNLDEALASCAEKLRASVSGKTEIVIAAIKAPDNKTADFLTAELTTHLMESGSFIVLERGYALKAVNAEHEFQMSGLVSDESAVGIGHYLGAKVVVTGTFEPYNGFNQFRLRAVDVRSSQLLAMPSSRINPKDKILSGVMPKDVKPQSIKKQTLDHLTRGKDLLREEKYDEAIREFDEAIRIEPNNAEAYAKRAAAYVWGKKDYDAAFVDINKAISLDSKNSEHYARRSSIYYHKNDLNNAIADQTQAIRLNPNSAELYMNRGIMYSANKDYDLALNDFNQAIKVDPNYLWTYSSRGDLYKDKNNYDLAIADYTHIIRIANKERDKPQLSVAYFSRGLLYHNNKKDYDKAIADYTESINNLPDSYKYAWRGDAYLAKKDYNRAIADFEEALKQDPNDSFAKRSS
jgi:tetratricopeptide (TPR) repeat protein